MGQPPLHWFEKDLRHIARTTMQTETIPLRLRVRMLVLVDTLGVVLSVVQTIHESTLLRARPGT
jgi:hypothetical protein